MEAGENSSELCENEICGSCEMFRRNEVQNFV